MASQRRDTTVLLNFDGGDGPQRADDGSILRLKLGVGERHLRRGSGDGNGTNGGGGPYRISRSSWVDLGCKESARRQAW
jgi:hypothetical protein